MVRRCHHAGAARRLLPGARVHGDPAARLSHLGADAARARRHDQGDGPSKRVLPALHPDELPREGGRARRGIREGGRPSHAYAFTGDRQRGKGCHRGRSHLGARGAARRAADVGDDHLRHAREVDPELPRLAGAAEPVVQHRPLGDAHAAVPAHHGVPLARRAYSTRHVGGSGGRGASDPRHLPPVPGGVARAAGADGLEDRQRALRGRGADLRARRPDARQQGDAGGDVALPRPELRQGVRRAIPDGRGRARLRVVDIVGRVHAPNRRADHDPLGRQRPDRASKGRTGAGRDRADLED